MNATARRTLAALAALSLTGLAACATSPAAPAPAPPTTSAPVERSWPTIQGEAGGQLTVDGTQVGRNADGATKAFLDRMGPTDETTTRTTCGAGGPLHTTHRWGDLRVVILDELDADNLYAETCPVGEVAGWVIDPTLDGAPGLTPELTGPEGTTIGTDLATLRERFDTDNWDRADREGDTFSIFAGDTTGASFDLDAEDQVVAMSAGYGCVPRT